MRVIGGQSPPAHLREAAPRLPMRLPMRLPIVLLLWAVVLVFCGCGDPLPGDKLGYAGRWAGANVTLEITLGGLVDYERHEGSSNVSINAPIIEFRGDDFAVGLWFMETTFVVSEPPNWNGESWTMVVDGRRLWRSGSPPTESNVGI